MTMYTMKATLEEADAIAKGDKAFIFRADSMPCFHYDNADRKTEPSGYNLSPLDKDINVRSNSSEKPNNCEHITEDGVTCAKYPACDDCLDNPLNKVKGSERLVKGSEKPNSSTTEDCSDVGKEQRMTIDIDQGDFGTLCVCALRYCHGRRTYMPSLVQGIVMTHFKDLSDYDLRVIAEDERFQSDMNLWGDECDKADWQWFYKILREWQTERSSK